MPGRDVVDHVGIHKGRRGREKGGRQRSRERGCQSQSRRTAGSGPPGRPMTRRRSMPRGWSTAGAYPSPEVAESAGARCPLGCAMAGNPGLCARREFAECTPIPCMRGTALTGRTARRWPCLGPATEMGSASHFSTVYSFKVFREAVQEVALSLIRRRSHPDLGRGHKGREETAPHKRQLAKSPPPRTPARGTQKRSKFWETIQSVKRLKAFPAGGL